MKVHVQGGFQLRIQGKIFRITKVAEKVIDLLQKHEVTAAKSDEIKKTRTFQHYFSLVIRNYFKLKSNKG